MDSNSPFSFNVFLNGLEIKAKARKMQLAGKPVPTHIELPELQDILKMRPAPTPDGWGEEGAHQDKIMKTFIFVIEHLVGGILGKRVWDRYKCRDRVSTKFTPSDKAFLYVILSNSYDLWIKAEGSRVGNGSLTKDGTNKKYCGWTKQGIKQYNDFMHKVKFNCQGVGVLNVEQTVMDVLKQWYEDETQRNALAVHRRQRKRK
jgi:hypothetical protein